MTEFEQQDRQLIGNMPNAYALHEIICDGNGVPADYRFLEVNAAFAHMTGLKAESLVGRTVLEVMPETERRWIETYGRVALTGEPVHFESFSRELDRHYEVVASRPAPNRFACSFTDITDRKFAGQALVRSKEETEQSRHFLEGILEAIGDPVFVKDDESRLLLVNDAFCEMFGLPKEAVLGKTLAEDVPPAEREHFLAIDRQVIANGAESIVEESLTVRGSSTRTIMTRKTRFTDQNGRHYLVGIIRDISSRKQAELDLAEEKERLAVTLRSIGDGVITTDTAGNVVMLSRSAEELTGWSSAEAEGRPLPEVFHIINERTRRPCRNPVEIVLATGEIIGLENHTYLVARDGREYVIADSAAPIRGNEGKVAGVVLVFRDMTEKKSLEDYVRRSQKLESLGVLAGGIAHDFNNLLGAIFGYVELALMETTESGVSENLSKSLQNIDRARGLTRQLLTFAKGGAPKMAVGNLSLFVERTARFVLSGSPISCRCDCPADLWSCRFDQSQIGQVIENITINAQQAMPDGGAITINLRNVSLGEGEHVLHAAGDYVSMSITDQGRGIPAAELGRIFDPYFSTKSDGHGLGLATCYSIVKQHDGWIDVESEPGRGSTFRVYLPAAEGDEQPERRQAKALHGGTGTFLIMDDEEAMRDLLARFLESFGYTVCATATGDEALEFCRDRARDGKSLAGMIFDLTVSGGLGGNELIPEIRQIYPDVPAFIASGYADDPVIAYPERYGFQASLWKPFVRQSLSDMLDAHMPPTRER